MPRHLRRSTARSLLAATLLTALLVSSCTDKRDRPVRLDDIANARSGMSKSQAVAAWDVLARDRHLAQVARYKKWVRQATLHPGTAGQVVIEADVASTRADELASEDCGDKGHHFDHLHAIVSGNKVRELIVSDGTWSCSL